MILEDENNIFFLHVFVRELIIISMLSEYTKPISTNSNKATKGNESLNY